MSRRGNGFAEYIEALRSVWGDDPVSYRGRFYQIPPAQIGPKPLRPDGLQILVGVVSESEIPVERAGRTGLGLHPIISDWKTFEHQLALFRAAAPTGGQPGPIVARVNNPVTETAIEDAGRGPMSGSVEQVKDDLHRAVELGIEHVMWDLTAAHVPYETQLRLMEPLIAARPQ